MPGDNKTFEDFIYEAKWRLLFRNKDNEEEVNFLDRTFKYTELDEPNRAIFEKKQRKMSGSRIKRSL